MLHAVLRDLTSLPAVELLVSRDSRLPPLDMAGVATWLVTADPWSGWSQALAGVDALWPIAPESGGILERLSRLAGHKKLLGSPPAAVALTASKWHTAQVLTHAGVAVVPTWHAGPHPPPCPPPWVVKPDDGAGCENTWCCPDSSALEQWLKTGNTSHHYIIQPRLPGVPASISMLCHEGHATLLSCNRQRIRCRRGVFSYHGSVLNDLTRHWPLFQHTASAVAAAIPELQGYVGVDVMLHQGKLTVLEINPRLTTSWAGLAQAIGSNPAEKLLELFYNETLPSPPIVRHRVMLHV